MLKVLIVDDEQNFRFYLRDIINWDNYNCKIVAICETGDEALEIIQNQSVDLAILIASKIMEEQLKVDKQNLLIDKFVEEVGASHW